MIERNYARRPDKRSYAMTRLCTRCAAYKSAEGGKVINRKFVCAGCCK